MWSKSPETIQTLVQESSRYKYAPLRPLLGQGRGLVDAWVLVIVLFVTLSHTVMAMTVLNMVVVVVMMMMTMVMVMVMPSRRHSVVLRAKWMVLQVRL
jgi:hypothetical protein